MSDSLDQSEQLPREPVILQFKLNDNDEIHIEGASARFVCMEDEEELWLHIEPPESDCAITVKFWKGLAGRPIVTVRTGAHQQRLSDTISIRSVIGCGTPSEGGALFDRAGSLTILSPGMAARKRRRLLQQTNLVARAG
jgi:hypothetical protein